MAYRLYARSVCDMNSAAAAAVCGLWHYTSVVCLLLCLQSSDNGSLCEYVCITANHQALTVFGIHLSLHSAVRHVNHMTTKTAASNSV